MSTAPGVVPKGLSSDVITLLDTLRVRDQRDHAAITLILDEALSQPAMDSVRALEVPGADRPIYAMTKPQLVDLLLSADFETWQPYDWLELDESGLQGNDQRLPDYRLKPPQKSRQAYSNLIELTLMPVDLAGGSRKHRMDGVDYYIFDHAMLRDFLREVRFVSWSAKDWDQSLMNAHVARTMGARDARDEVLPPFPGMRDEEAPFTARRRSPGPV